MQSDSDCATYPKELLRTDLRTSSMVGNFLDPSLLVSLLIPTVKLATSDRANDMRDQRAMSRIRAMSLNLNIRVSWRGER